MAWWNNPAGGQTPEVSLERVAAWFDAQGFAYELTEDNPGLAAGFGRYGYVIEVLDDIMAVHARFWTDLPDDEATTAGVRGLLSVLQEVEIFEFVEEGALTPQEGVLPYPLLELGGLDDLLDLGATALDVLDRHGRDGNAHGCSSPRSTRFSTG